MGLDNPLHIAFLLIVLLLVFGAKRLPEIGRSIGTGMREFKDSISGDTHTHTLAQSTPQPMQQQPHQQPVAQAPVVAPPVPVASAQPAPAPVEPTPQA